MPQDDANQTTETRGQNASPICTTTAVTIALTLFVSPDRLSKRIERRDGVPGTFKKISGVFFKTGTATRTVLAAPTPAEVLRSLGRLLEPLPSTSAIGLGVAANRKAVNPITTKDGLKRARDGAIPRDKTHFTFAEGLSLVLCDFDGLTRGRNKLLGLSEAFADVAMLTKPSASAGVVDSETGAHLAAGGEHVYFIARQARHQALLHAIRRLAWKRGLGTLRLSKAGTVLAYGLVDTTVYGAERLIYEGRPELDPMLTQEPPHWRVEGTGILDADAFIAEVDRIVPEAAFKALVAAAEADPAFKAERERVRALFLTEWAERGMARGLSPKRARTVARIVARAASIKVSGRLPRFALTADDVVETQDGRTVGVAAILKEPEKHVGLGIADPHEGRAYGTSTAIIYRAGRRPFIFSHAHGGCVYRLLAAPHIDETIPGNGDDGVQAGEATVNEDLTLLTQRDVANVFTARHAGRLRYCHDTGRWYLWTGTHWQRQKTQLAFYLCRELAAELSEGFDDKDVKEASRANFASGVERMAQSAPRVAVTSEAWNADPFLLGTPGGTVDLRTGELRVARAEEGISKITAVALADRADCRRWRAFLKEATRGDAGMIRFLQQWSGMNLTGDISEQKLVFVWGGGGNGKGVFIATIGGVLGHYKREAAMDTFLATHGTRHPTDLAHLFGARMVTATETTEGRAWDEPRIKQLTGGDVITARFMHRDFFEYVPTFKLTIIGNHKPTLKSVDDALRRRLLIVPFVNKPAKVDPHLIEKISAERPAVLRWMIEGCLDWQKNGLVVPKSISDATVTYFEDQDTFSDWLEEACRVEIGNEHLKAGAGELFQSWSAFAARNHIDVGSSKAFGETLAGHGFPRGRDRAWGRHYTGIQLKRQRPHSEPDEPDDADAWQRDPDT